MLDEGHEIANHSYAHIRLGEASKDMIRENIVKGIAVIKEFTGSETVLFRAPYVSWNDEGTQLLTEMGLVMIIGSISHDSDREISTGQIIENVLGFAKDGGVIVFHDFGNVNTMPAIPVIAEELTKQGYIFITVSDMIKLKNVELEPGKRYDYF